MTLWPLVKWGLLGAYFWIPGAYIEWPSDPWEHLRRINEWRGADLVTTHSAWGKASYFLLFSVTAWATAETQLAILDVWYTCVALLLCWQYYRLGLALGLSCQGSFLFVAFVGAALGNSAFSFFRYYGLSSTMLAQLGAIALVRLAVEAQDWPRGAESRSSWPRLRTAYMSLFLVFLIAVNHVQGGAIAALGMVSVVTQRVVSSHRSARIWFVGILLAASGLVAVWYPRDEMLFEGFLRQGWLNAWMGFNLLEVGSPAFGRAAEILGWFGILNLIAGAYLLVCNHLGGWLTVSPLLVLSLPCAAIPLAQALGERDGGQSIILFQRFLFAIPPGFAIVACGEKVFGWLHRRRCRIAGYMAPLPVALIAFTVGAGSGAYERFWHSVAIIPADLQLGSHVAAGAVAKSDPALEDSTVEAIFPLTRQVSEALQYSLGGAGFRPVTGPMNSAAFVRMLDTLEIAGGRVVGVTFESDSMLRIIADFEPPSAGRTAGLLSVDLTNRDAQWISLGGYAHQVHENAERIVLSNPIARASYPFSKQLIPVERSRRYWLRCSVRQSGSRTARSYLAVAWYDRLGNLLPSGEESPLGAGSPLGWVNGTYSYFGLENAPAPAEWTDYDIRFGFGENAVIPETARFLRVGALLNYQDTERATIEYSRVILQQMPEYRRMVVVAPSRFLLITPYSTAACLSQHWSPNRVAQEHAGLPEFASQAEKFRERIISK